jgi:hypothetical protein
MTRVEKALHAHQVAITGDDGVVTTVFTAADDGNPHGHDVTLPDGNVVRTSTASGYGVNHVHTLEIEGGQVTVTSQQVSVVAVQVLKAVEMPEVLSYEAVRTGAVPPLGDSRLPPSLEADIPPEYRYWLCKSRVDAVAVHQSLIESGIVDSDRLDVVDGELRRVVYAVEKYLPDPADGEPEVPVRRRLVEQAAAAAGIDADDTLMLDGATVQAFGYEAAAKVVAASARDWVIELPAGSEAEATAMSDDGTAVFKLLVSDDSSFLSSRLPVGVRWNKDAPGDAVAELQKRVDTTRVAKSAASTDQWYQRFAGAINDVLGKKVHGDTDQRVAARLVKAIDSRMWAGETEVLKRAGVATTTTREVRIVKDLAGAEDQRFVLGVVMEPDVVDAHGEYASAETIQKACYEWIESYGILGLQHQTVVNDKVKLLENYIALNDITIGDEVIKKGSWVMAVRYLDDDLWQAVKSGEISGFSIGGYARRVPVAEGTEVEAAAA